MKELLAVARGEKAADLVIRGARVANVYTLEYESVDVALWQDKIVGVGENYDGAAVVEAEGRVLIPGLIDGHVHVESTMLAPAAFAESVAVRGTTTVMPDPHEIANVLGMRGVEYMFTASQGLSVDFFWGAPSCVPASPFETPFEELGMDRVGEMFRLGWCQHLGEVMNYPGVVAGDPEVWGKMLAAGGAVRTGHAPGLTGKPLCAYLMGGISSDHECTAPAEALEKLRRGMWLMMREGASSPDLRRLLPVLRDNPSLASRCMVVSDDITAKYLTQVGHMDAKLRILAEEGVAPLVALRMVTLAPASYFGLKDRGAIAPGLAADLVLVDSIERCGVDKVWKNGRLVVDEGKLLQGTRASSASLPWERGALPVASPTLEQLAVSAPKYAELSVIGINRDSLATTALWLRPSVSSGLAVPDRERDLAKIVVQERHRGTQNLAIGFVSGLGMQKGAIASSVAHDAHHFVATGMDDLSIQTALAHLGKNGGGLVVACDDKVLEYFALPVAGLMTTLDAAAAAQTLDRLEDGAKGLGVKVAHPFMVLSFLCLSVIPELKLTDQGYVNLGRGGRQPLFGFTEIR